jgi:hypothetical protein
MARTAAAMAVTEGRVVDGTLTFRTSAALNGREIVLRWEGQVKDGALRLFRRLPNDAALAPLDMRR